MMKRAAVVAAAATTVFASAFLTGPGLALTAMSTGLNAPVAQAAAPAPKKCPAGTQSGTIGGASKCLAAGQQCQQAHVADYPKYGFTCSHVGQRYQLTKRGAAAKPAAKPAPKPATTRH